MVGIQTQMLLKCLPVRRLVQRHLSFALFAPWNNIPPRLLFAIVGWVLACVDGRGFFICRGGRGIYGWGGVGGGFFFLGGGGGVFGGGGGGGVFNFGVILWYKCSVFIPKDSPKIKPPL